MPRRRQEQEKQKASKVVSVRMTEAEFARLQEDAVGRSTVSDLIRSRALSEGFSNSTRLRLVGELVTISTRLRTLATQQQFSQSDLQSTLDRLGKAVDQIAKRAKP